MVALGDWLRCYRVRELAGLDPEALGRSDMVALASSWPLFLEDEEGPGAGFGVWI